MADAGVAWQVAFEGRRFVSRREPLGAGAAFDPTHPLACKSTHSWLNRSRRLLVRWEKKVEYYAAFLHLMCAQLMLAKVFRGK